MINTVFFDFGGTLFYEKRKVPEEETVMSGYMALKGKGIQVPFEVFMDIFQIPYRQTDLEFAKRGLEVSIRDFSRKIMPKVGLEPSDEIIDAYLWGRFQPHSVNNEMYDDVLPTFKALKPGSKIGLISNAQPLGIRWVLDQTGIVTYFDEIIVSGAVGLQKPNPEIFRLAARSICAKPEECLMVGDSPPADAMAAESAGMTGVVIDRTGRVEKAFPDVKAVSDMRQILKFIG